VGRDINDIISVRHVACRGRVETDSARAARNAPVGTRCPKGRSGSNAGRDHQCPHHHGGERGQTCSSAGPIESPSGGADRLLRLPVLRRASPGGSLALRLADCDLPGPGGACSGSPRPRPGPLPHGPAAAPAMNSAASSTGRTGRSGWSQSPGARRHAPRPRHSQRRRTRRPAVPRNPRRAAQRIGLRPCLALRPYPRPRARTRRQRARPPPLRPAARRPVAVAERRREPCRRSPPGPGTASPSCSPSTATASTATRTSSTSRSATSSSRPQDMVRARPWKSQRLHRPRDGRGGRPLCVRGFPSRPADGPWTTPTPNGHAPKQQPWPQSFPLIKANIRTRSEQRPAA
jgi:hypothetical protein